jgi:hypothetical protein
MLFHIPTQISHAQEFSMIPVAPALKRAAIAFLLTAAMILGLCPTTAYSQLNGTYTIGSGGSYTSFTAAVAALTTNGVSGAVTFNVLSGTYNETFTIPEITGASATNTITFDGGTGNASTRIVSYAVTATYGAVITLNGADYVTIKNLTIRSTDASYGSGIHFTNSADYNEISNCVIELPQNTTSDYHSGIRAGSTTSMTTAGDYGNFNVIKNNTITNAGYYGAICWYGSGSTDYTISQGNQFIGNTMTEWYYNGLRVYYGGSVLVKGNTSIQRTTGNFYTTSGAAYYLYYLSNGPEISYNYGKAAYYAFYPYYINNSRANTSVRAKIYNNMAVTEGTSTVYGMYLYSGVDYDCVYNSVRSKTTGTSSAYGIYSYRSAGAYYCTVANNMVQVEGGGTQYMLYGNAPAVFTQFDNNLYWATGTGTQSYYWNATTYTSLTDLKNATTGVHDNSVYANPEWFTATDLHSTSLAAYQAGVPFTGITDDYDGNTRSTTMPCMGADEFVVAPMAYASSTVAQPNTGYAYSGLPDQDIIRIGVTVTGSLTPISATSFSLNTTGSTSASNISAAKLYYTGRIDEFSTGTLVGSYINPNGSFIITGSQALEGPGTNYFWLAYDVATSAPSGNYLDAQCTSVTVAGTAYTPSVTNPTGSRQIVQPMSGTYTINPTGSGTRNFTSFTAAITALDTYGVNGATTFEVAAATYNEQLTVSPITGASSTNTVTFDGGTGNAASRIITYAVNATYGSVITIYGADFIRFKNLTVNSTDPSNGYCFLLTNPTGTDPSEYNEISNCVLNLPANTTSSYHIGIVANSLTSYSSNGNWANYNLIQGNTINSGYYGMTWRGTSGSLTSNVGNEFIGNTIQDFYYYGMYMYYSVGVKIVKNRIVQRTAGTITTTSGYGIYHYYAYEGPQFVGNYISSVYGGMYVVYSNSVNSSTLIRGKCYNNMITVKGTSTNYGLYFSYPRYSDVVYNSVYTNTTGTAYGLYNYGASSSYDNKFVNNYVMHEGSGGTWYPMYHYYVADMSQYDNNAYFRVGVGTDSYYWGSTTYNSLTAVQAVSSSFHQNSIWGNPYYYSSTDLHSNSHVGYQAGIAFPGITDDFDGDMRNSSPCIGADEYPAPPPENDVAVLEAMLNTADGQWAHIEDPAIHTVKAVIGNVGLSVNPTTVSVTYKVGSAPTSEFDGVQQTFTPTWVNRKATVQFTQQISGLAASTTPSVYVRIFWAADEDVTNDVSMDNAFVEVAKVHGIENFEKMEVGQYPYTRDAGYLDLPWSRIDNNGGSSLSVMAGTGNGGNGLAMNAPAEAADEWIIMPGAELLAGSSYRFGFDFRNWGGSPVTIQAAWGTTPDPTQMSVFATFANIMPGGFVTAKQLAGGFDPYFNTPMFNQTYFVAMRFTTSGTNAYFSIDNIKMDDNPSPPPKIAFGLPGADLSTFIDNPTAKITVLANYKQPGIINRTYEVQNKINIYGTNGDFLWDVETSTPWIKLTKETPNPTLQGYNLTPPRPRQFQTFTLTVNPAGLAAGTHTGDITFYGILFNDDFPPPANGLVATNEPLIIPVELIITSAGSKTVPSISQTIATPLTVPGSPYNFVDPNTGDPIATVEVTSGQIATMTITAFPNQLPQNLQRKLFVKRYWQIQHTGSGWTANVTFPYADIEASMITDKMQLRGVRQAVMLGAWEDPIMGTSSASDPLTNSVKVHDFNEWNIGGNIALTQPYFVAGKSGAGVPETFGLEQNYPNPFNPTTSIVFTVAEERAVRLAVYNGLGAEVAELVNDVLPAGRYEVSFDASDLPSGTYIYRMLAGEFTATQRMTLSK